MEGDRNSEDTITDLDAIVKSWAKEKWENALKISDRLERYKGKDMIIVPHFDKTIIEKQGETIFTQITNQPEEAGKSIPNKMSQCVFESTFNNYTGESQKHAFKCERSTLITEDITITTGFKKGGTTASFQVGIPKILNTKIGGQLAKDKSSVNSTKTSKARTLTWSTDSQIPVPAQNQVTAVMEILEEEYKGNFEAKVHVSGLMEVEIIDPDSWEKAYIARGDLVEIINLSNKRKPGDLKFINGQSVWTVKGKCDYRYGAKQIINTSCSAIGKEKCDDINKKSEKKGENSTSQQ
ncbi:uncharacterized protein LOC132552281 [Ylistrum balloti]|uniref:uncharacterized protein LOC132552281 n=1 Tax=Ylistrum balloti TaxID=509963 RepID=UPI002905CCE3|nr:uncharacterized protein LOC132552281 [Ylistrum balloti]